MAYLLAVPVFSLGHAFTQEDASDLHKRLRITSDASVQTEVSHAAYFAAFPDSFEGMAKLYSADYRSALALTQDERTPEVYVVAMCRAYAHVDHRNYIRKLLRIGVDADDWGETGRERERVLYPGDAYLRLMYGTACEQPTAESIAERRAHIFALAPDFSDAEIESIYKSLSWEADFRSPLEWFLTGLCNTYPSRCALTKRLHDRYVSAER